MSSNTVSNKSEQEEQMQNADNSQKILADDIINSNFQKPSGIGSEEIIASRNTESEQEEQIQNADNSQETRTDDVDSNFQKPSCIGSEDIIAASNTESEQEEQIQNADNSQETRRDDVDSNFQKPSCIGSEEIISARNTESEQEEQIQNADNSQETRTDDAGSDSELKSSLLEMKKQLWLRSQSGETPFSLFQNFRKMSCIKSEEIIAARNTESKQEEQTTKADNSQETHADDDADDDDSDFPPLERRHNQNCIYCNLPAELYCGRCGIAPYCNRMCQQADWEWRHRDICHQVGSAARPHTPDNRNRDGNSDRTDETENFYPAGQRSTYEYDDEDWD